MPPLHILAIISDPQDVPRLDVVREWQALCTALTDLQSAGLVTLERLPQATYAALQERLRAAPVHILHFIGHGYFEGDSGGLVLEDGSGHAVRTDAVTLGTLLHDHEALRLAFLNACEGARGGTGDFFAGVAQRLAQQQVPAVVAMQFTVTDRAAIDLARNFYGGLAAGLAVDEALAEARKAIFEMSATEWATPVLFSRADDNRLLALPPAARRVHPTRILRAGNCLRPSRSLCHGVRCCTRRGSPRVAPQRGVPASLSRRQISGDQQAIWRVHPCQGSACPAGSGLERQ